MAAWEEDMNENMTVEVALKLKQRCADKAESIIQAFGVACADKRMADCVDALQREIRDALVPERPAPIEP